MSKGLYDPRFEKDNCGFGLITQMDGKPSHWIVEAAISSLSCLSHRGAIAADGKTGDGCGLLFKQPDEFMRRVAKEHHWDLAKHYAVGMVFHNQQIALAEKSRATLDSELKQEGLIVLGWRKVPTDSQACGSEALKSLPIIEQIFVNAPDPMTEEEFERRLFMARRRAEIKLSKDDTFYISTLSSRVIAYKALIMPENLQTFYPDLQDKKFASSLCIFHQRFSTNTWPQWRLSQPFRYLAHNGEINTIQGNRNWALARGCKLKNTLIPNMGEIQPIVSDRDSDSCSLDNVLEVLMMGGMDIFRAMRLLIPPAWQNINSMDSNLRAFYEYYSLHMGAWDGPAGIVLTDGRYAVCTVDRNGLRPTRYLVTKDRFFIVASETGVHPFPVNNIVSKGRLRPGEMIAIDTHKGQLLLSKDIDDRLKDRQPYKHWLKQNAQYLFSDNAVEFANDQGMDKQQLLIAQKMFQVTFEERDQIIRVLAELSQEAVGSMGDDTPMPVLSEKVRSLYDYFRQQFAQVTNPPIDPLREKIVMSLEVCHGRERELFKETAQHAIRLVVKSPVLSISKYKLLISQDSEHFKSAIISLHYLDTSDLQSALLVVCQQAVEHVRNGKTIIVLSDRKLTKGMLPIHALLATGAVHQQLVKEGLRCDANIVVETATARDPHHFAVLIGNGATSIYPYLSYQVIKDLVATGEIKQTDFVKLYKNYRAGIRKGLYKIMSKMGISTIRSYRGAQLFEIIGMHPSVVEMCFRGTPSRISGMRFKDIENDQRLLANEAWNNYKPISQGGLLKYIHGGEYHAYNPDVITTLQSAVKSGKYADYLHYAEHVNTRLVTTLRDLFSLRQDLQSIDINDVEPIETIVKRFDSAGMSLGALSPEAHEALAIAMNRLGGRSNSGEGGEDQARYGTEKMSKIKQIASGRFGVTPHYLVNAEVLQIKIAQGAKPGEGGQLPAHKVNEMIATLRYAKPGISLISPPPHHDIYSIEDLAQLIFDLKQVNPEAFISVKLVSEAGVGTIAAGVAKAYADMITISGYDGGTGASPLSSVKYAGTPWELGLSEIQQTLRANNLRKKIILQTDGGLKTGLDVIKAAILGAESFGFGTAPMVALGCKYLRICHLNNCATGVATQDKVLRMHHFSGEVEMVMNYFKFVAMETREWLSRLGVTRLIDLIGRTDLLTILPGTTEKQQQLDLLPILSHGGVDQNVSHYCTEPRNHPADKAEYAEKILAEILPAIKSKKGGEFKYDIRNVNRSIGARISGVIAKLHGRQGLEGHPLTLKFTGNAGQSFGVWNAPGLHLYIEGDANDYVGKGMAGGKIVIYPPRRALFNSNEAVIIGNTCLYGATGGKLFAAGIAGERFAVRNSGAQAVIEGVGDHCCEYMTGGVVVVLGQTGLNFGAGMTGGLAFVLDQDNKFVDRYNNELIDIYRINNENMESYYEFLHAMIKEYVEETNSALGRQIINDFRDYFDQFWLVKPKASDLEHLLDTLSRAA